MKKTYCILVIALLCCFTFKTVAAVRANTVYNKPHVPVLKIPDTLDISQTLSRSLVRSGNILQFNRLIGVYLNQAIDSLKKGKLQVAEEIMMTDALPMLSHYGDGYNMFHIFMTLGKSYHQQKKYTQAKWFFIQANGISQKIGYHSGELFSLIELAKVKESINDNKLALDDYKAAALLAEKIKFNDTLVSIRKSIQRLTDLSKPATGSPALPVMEASKN